MIEVLFVIVILGIVGGIALETIRQYYENIYRTQEYTKRVSDADHILDQVSKYFENAISSSIVNLDKDDTTGCEGPPEFDPLNPDLSDYTIAFVAPDSDSLRGTSGNRPGWSEDTLLMSNNELNASDADYTMADDDVIQKLGSTLRNSAVYDHESTNIGACARFNWDDAGGYEGFHKLNVAANPISSTKIRLNADNLANDGKRKYLLRTGYAFRVISNPGQPDDGNLMMYTNFRPWADERYTEAGKINLLGENVAHFYADYDARDFMANANLNDRGLVWRLKVCMRGLDANLSDTDAESQTICRERRVHVRY